MSNEALTWAFKLKGLQTTPKFVLVALADLADERHSCYPGQKMIAERIGGTDRTVRRALIALEELGLVEREERRAADGYRTSDRYVLAVGMALPDDLSGSSHRTSATVSPDNDDSLTGQSVRAIEPLVNPQKKNPQKRASRIPSPFVLTKEMREWAVAETPAVNVDEATKRFVDYWRAEPDKTGRKLDWVATWRNSMRRSQDFAVRDGWKPSDVPVRNIDEERIAEQKAAWCELHGVTPAELAAHEHDVEWIRSVERGRGERGAA